MTRRLTDAKRVVVKIGSALLADPGTGTLRHDWLHALAEDLAAFRDHGQEVEWAKTWGFGSVQAIHVLPSGDVDAVSDPRRGGVAGVEGFRPARPGE